MSLVCEVQSEVWEGSGVEVGTLFHTVIQGSSLIDILLCTAHSF